MKSIVSAQEKERRDGDHGPQQVVNLEGAGFSKNRGFKDLSHSSGKIPSKAVDHFLSEELRLVGRAEKKTETEREEMLAQSTAPFLKSSFEVSINLSLIPSLCARFLQSLKC